MNSIARGQKIPIFSANGGDAGLNHLLGVDTGERIDGLALNVQVVLSHDGGSFVDRFSRSIENSSQHVLRHGRTENVAGELTCRPLRVDSRCSLENLNHSL